MHLLLLMNVVLHFISMSFAQLWETGNWRKIQNENICLHRESNLRLLAFQSGALDHLAMMTAIDLWFKLLHYSNLWIYSTQLTMHVLNWLWLDMYWNWLSYILFISYTNVDAIYYCSQYLVWANQTIIMHYLIELRFVGVHLPYELPREKEQIFSQQELSRYGLL